MATAVALPRQDGYEADILNLINTGLTDGVGASSCVSETAASSPASASASAPARKLIVVANRLPISVTKNAKTGEYAFKMSSGGLVSALVSVRDKISFVWMGWLGTEIPEADQPAIAERLWREYTCCPVFLPSSLADMYYNGFANDVLWPLLHYEHLMGGNKPFDERLYAAYVQANTAFADAIAAQAAPTDLIWVHDYHLMLVPAMLRAKLPESTIAWFLHTPWPSSEVYRTLPVREAVLEGLLACDLVGFHTYDYHRHFLSSACRILPGATALPTAIRYRDRTVRAHVFPIGIEPEQFVNTSQAPACQRRITELCDQFAGKRVIIAVDRLDPIKGMPHRFLGLATLFKRYPEWVGKVVMLQVAVPSRTDVETYQRLTTHVNTLVGSINAAYGDLSYQPVHYFYRSIDPTELTALYTIADVALITSLRDGMNLVSEEYVACQGTPCPLRSAPGVLVLSEFAGCAQSLAGAIRVNPWSADDIADALNVALSMPDAARQARWESLHAYVHEYTSRHWADAFVSTMRTAAASSTGLTAAPDGFVAVQVAYRSATRRLLLLQYEGGLCPRNNQANMGVGELTAAQELGAYTSVPQPPSFALSYLIHELARDPANTVVIVSSLPRQMLEEWFRDTPRLALIAEDGCAVRAVAGDLTAVAAIPAVAGLEHNEYPATYHGSSNTRVRTKLTHVFPALATRILKEQGDKLPSAQKIARTPRMLHSKPLHSGVALGSTDSAAKSPVIPSGASAAAQARPAWQLTAMARSSDDWKSVSLQLVHAAADDVPGTLVHETAGVVAWIYDALEDEYGVYMVSVLRRFVAERDGSMRSAKACRASSWRRSCAPGWPLRAQQLSLCTSKAG